ncbi:hypothetical protein LEN26_014100 [Aphanomyces euteiches]|nr:hypothetical protein LEN26_014100 [Aphanomyces euteiches]
MNARTTSLQDESSSSGEPYESITKNHDSELASSPLMRKSITAALVGAMHFGWMSGEMGYLPFHNPQYCAMPEIPAGQCILFPGHTTAEWTMQATALAVGGAIGALLSAYPADKYGRKRTLGWNGIIMIVGGLIQLISADIYTFAIGRGINGIACGIAVNVITNYLREISPIPWRMFYVTMFQIASTFGSLIVTTLMYAISHVPNEWEYKYFFGGPILLGLIQIVVMRYIIESPTWLIQTQQIEESRQAMNQLYMPGDVESHWMTKVEAVGRQAQEIQSSSSKLGLLLSRKYSKQFLIAITLATMVQLCGLSALVVYGPQIFQGIGIRELRLSGTLTNFSRLDYMYLAARYGSKFSRRSLFLVGSVGFVLGAMGFTFCQIYPNETTKWLQLVCLMIFILSFCFSVGSLGWLVATELVPEALGATLGSISTFFTWVAQFFIGVYFQQISNTKHWGTQAFFIFAVVNFIFFFFVMAFVPDTNNKSTDEVTAIFSPEVNAIDDTDNTFNTSVRTPVME